MKKYWVRLKGQEEYPIVCELPDKIEGFITTKRTYKDGGEKTIGFHTDMIISMEEYEEETKVDIDEGEED